MLTAHLKHPNTLVMYVLAWPAVVFLGVDQGGNVKFSSEVRVSSSCSGDQGLAASGPRGAICSLWR